MLTNRPIVDPSNPTPAEPTQKTARAEWENEGGAMRDGPSTQGPAVIGLPASDAEETPEVAAAVDAIQDKLMGVESSDGTPPSRAWRLEGRRWLIVAAVALLALGGAVWIGLAMGVGTAIAALVIVLLMGGAAAPVWGAGLLRGKEERAARVEAQAAVGMGPGFGRGASGGEIAPMRRIDVGGSGL